LKEFGFADLAVKAKDFTKPGSVIQLGRAPNRIDLLTSITGVTTEQAFQAKVAASLDELAVAFLSKDLLIANKRAVGRAQDLADLEQLQ
jgi:hypothetical protein